MNNTTDTEFLRRLGGHVAKVRREKGFTQKQVANNADIEISQISRIERGIINPTICTLNEISEALGISLKELVI